LYHGFKEIFYLTSDLKWIWGRVGLSARW